MADPVLREQRRFASRKFVFSVAVWIGGTIGWSTGMMDSAQWTEFSRWILGIYLAGNVGETAFDVMFQRKQ